jgi:sec-independent protein translocase protein TatC
VELRHRIFIVIGWLLGAAVIAFLFSNQLLELIALPKGDIQLIVLAPIDMLWATSAFAYFIMLPFAPKYLASFGLDITRASWNVRAYFSFTLGVMLWMGVAFETPLIMAMLARMGGASPKAMLEQWWGLLFFSQWIRQGYKSRL